MVADREITIPFGVCAERVRERRQGGRERAGKRRIKGSAKPPLTRGHSSYSSMVSFILPGGFDAGGDGDGGGDCSDDSSGGGGDDTSGGGDGSSGGGGRGTK